VGSLATPLLVLVFLVGVVATWLAGTRLSTLTDALDNRFGLGQELGGILLLAIAGSLPELAITVSGAARGNLDLAAGNLIGGIAMQTMVLALCDFATSGDKPLTYLVGRLTPVLEALGVVLVVAIVMMGALLRPSTAIGGVVSPASVVIVLAWLLNIYVVNRARLKPRWSVTFPGSKPGRKRRERVSQPAPRVAKASTSRIVTEFVLACTVTLVAGVFLEISGNTLADRAGINGVIFGATVLALATALPEISSGIKAVKIGDNALAMGDIFGGNSFQVCLFLLADLVAGAPVLPAAGRLNSWLAALGIGLTSIYAIGIIFRPNRKFWRLGADSLIAIVLFALGIAGLVVLPT
jgi:cation:H+ antiporter